MGKYKSRRYRIHTSATTAKASEKKPPAPSESSNKPPLTLTDNVFGGIDLVALLGNSPKDKEVPDDTISVKSYISNKSIKGDSILPKKEKRKLRKQLLLRKIDTVNQLKKELKEKQKKKLKNDTLGDMKNLLDSLPTHDLSSAMHNTKVSTTHIPKTKKKAIEKSKKIQKKTIQQVNIYKSLLKNQALTKDPFGTISQHLQAVVEHEKKAATINNSQVGLKKKIK